MELDYVTVLRLYASCWRLKLANTFYGSIHSEPFALNKFICFLNAYVLLWNV